MRTERRKTRNRKFQWTIARKIGGLSAILILFILSLLIYSIVTLRSIQAELKEISELDVPFTELSNQIEIQQLEQQISMEQLLRLARRTHDTQNEELLQDVKQSLENHSTALNDYIETGIRLSEAGLKSSYKMMFETVRSSLLDLQQSTGELHSVLFNMIKMIEAGAYPDDEAIDQMLVMDTALDNTMVLLIEKIELFTDRQIKVLESHERIFFLVNTSLGVSGVLLGIILSTMVIVGIRSNLFRLKQQVTEVSQAITENRVISTPSENVDTSDEIGELSENLSLMISNISTDFKKRDELSRHLRKIATSDPLTGAFNRLKWEENLAWEIERIKRSRDELSMTLFDIDFFKKINDTHGHDIGDQVLIEITELVSGEIRKSDSLYRIGGEEFVILTPLTQLDQAVILAEKVRRSIEDHEFDKVGTVTVSMGCAQFNKLDSDGEAMFKRADQAMYRAKESGRNRVFIETDS